MLTILAEAIATRFFAKRTPRECSRYPLSIVKDGQVYRLGELRADGWHAVAEPTY